MGGDRGGRAARERGRGLLRRARSVGRASRGEDHPGNRDSDDRHRRLRRMRRSDPGDGGHARTFSAGAEIREGVRRCRKSDRRGHTLLCGGSEGPYLPRPRQHLWRQGRMISRRDLVLGAGALAASARLVLAETLGGFQVIRARKVHGALMGPQNPGTDLWAFSDAWPPPVLRAKQGEQLKTRFVNELDRLISIHWFGIRGPTDLMSLAVEPGEENAIDCSFAPPDAGTFWIGPISDVSRL